MCVGLTVLTAIYILILLYQFPHSDIHKIEDGIGYNFANFVQECVGLLAGVIIALVLNWRLALVISTFLPLLIVVMIIVGKVSKVNHLFIIYHTIKTITCSIIIFRYLFMCLARNRLL